MVGHANACRPITTTQGHVWASAQQGTLSPMATASPHKTAPPIKCSKTGNASVSTTPTSSTTHAPPAQQQRTTTPPRRHASTVLLIVLSASTTPHVQSANSNSTTIKHPTSASWTRHARLIKHSRMDNVSALLALIKLMEPVMSVWLGPSIIVIKNYAKIVPLVVCNVTMPPHVTTVSPIIISIPHWAIVHPHALLIRPFSMEDASVNPTLTGSMDSVPPVLLLNIMITLANLVFLASPTVLPALIPSLVTNVCSPITLAQSQSLANLPTVLSTKL